ncbi:hypothetical protein AKO1_012955 [Acrasis kona]|uniref:RING-type domain-containing protein n=1 Tax=Acrasis kona TaxID=1008807 RepID=A0AAW2Z143_9EUKA
METTNGNNIKADNFNCIVCLKLIVEPVALPCSHSFCKTCMENVLKQPRRICPLCRSDVSFLNAEDLRPNAMLKELLTIVFKDEYAERVAEIEEERRLASTFNTVRKRIHIGNEHSQVIEGGKLINHKWTLFVTMSDEHINDQQDQSKDYISHIDVNLHPTFEPNFVTLRKAPFCLHRSGWGTFLVQVGVHFKPSLNHNPMTLTHHLNFSAAKDQSTHVVVFEIPKEKPTLVVDLDEIPTPTPNNVIDVDDDVFIDDRPHAVMSDFDDDEDYEILIS